MKKVISVLALVGIFALFFVANLYKGVIPTGGDPFSVKNILTTALFFLVVVPLLILINKKSAGKNGHEK